MVAGVNITHFMISQYYTTSKIMKIRNKFSKAQDQKWKPKYTALAQKFKVYSTSCFQNSTDK